MCCYGRTIRVDVRTDVGRYHVNWCHFVSITCLHTYVRNRIASARSHVDRCRLVLISCLRTYVPWWQKDPKQRMSGPYGFMEPYGFGPDGFGPYGSGPYGVGPDGFGPNGKQWIGKQRIRTTDVGLSLIHI